MDKAYYFARGQVWYWNDPMYSVKEAGKRIHHGDATVRFSRYVLIFQSSETISGSSILVIPLSSKNNTIHDVKIPLAHYDHSTFSHAKVRSLFPIDPKQLERYICTLPESSMKQIEAEILRLTIPSVLDKIPEYKELEISRGTPTIYEPPKVEVESVANVTDGTDQIEVEENTTSETHGVVQTDDTLYIPELGRGVYILSKFSHAIKESLIDMDFLEQVRPYLKNPKTKMFQNAFYEDMRDCIWSSLMDYLNIQKEDGSDRFIYPELSINSPQLTTWIFLDKLRTHGWCGLGDPKKGVKMMKLFSEIYPDYNAGIHPDWLKHLGEKLAKKIPLIDSGVELITRVVETKFCQKPKEE